MRGTLNEDANVLQSGSLFWVNNFNYFVALETLVPRRGTHDGMGGGADR